MSSLLDVLLTCGDFLWGRLLHPPSDAALVLAALAGALAAALPLALTAPRRWRKQAAADRRRLRALIREARRDNDAETLKRLRTTLAEITAMAARRELFPLVLSLPLLATLGVWCSQRLSHHPPQVGETVELVLHAPASAIGEAVHLVPQDDLQANGWLRIITAESADRGRAVWRLRGRRAGIYPLLLRYRGETFTGDFAVGRTTCELGKTWLGSTGRWRGGLRLRPRKLGGWLPGLGLPPWLTAYLLIALPAAWLLRRIF